MLSTSPHILIPGKSSLSKFAWHLQAFIYVISKVGIGATILFFLTAYGPEMLFRLLSESSINYCSIPLCPCVCACACVYVYVENKFVQLTFPNALYYCFHLISRARLCYIAIWHCVFSACKSEGGLHARLSFCMCDCCCLLILQSYRR